MNEIKDYEYSVRDEQKMIQQSSATDDSLYSLECAHKFNWSSVTGILHPERLSHLEKYLIGKDILDAGCGGGAYVEFLSSEGFTVTGIDNHSAFISDALSKGRKGTFLQADVCNLPFTRDTFDCTYCFDVLEHTNDIAAIQELARVTVKRLILAVPKEDESLQRFGITFSHYQDRTHLRNYSEASLKQLASNIHYSELRVFPELAIPFRLLVREMIKKPGLASPWRKYVTRALIKLLDGIPYKEVHTGLVAIVDF